MRFSLAQRRVIWCPTWQGWSCLFVIVAAPLILWVFYGECVLSATNRLPAEVLIFEAWTNVEGAEAAATEFRSGKAPYKHVIAVGGLTGAPWTRKRWSYVEIAEREFRRAGIPSEVIVTASVADVQSLRTYATAVATREALESRGLHPKTVNVFTRGVHASRSRFIFAQVLGPETKVGVIGWIPPGQDSGRWWASTERTSDFLKESLACPVEFLFQLMPRSIRPLIEPAAY